MEEAGCRPSEPLDFSDWWCASESALCALCFSMHSVPSFLVFMFWSTGTRLAVTSVFNELIGVCLVMLRCMFVNASLHVWYAAVFV